MPLQPHPRSLGTRHIFSLTRKPPGCPPSCGRLHHRHIISHDRWRFHLDIRRGSVCVWQSAISRFSKWICAGFPRHGRGVASRRSLPDIRHGIRLDARLHQRPNGQSAQATVFPSAGKNMVSPFSTPRTAGRVEARQLTTTFISTKPRRRRKLERDESRTPCGLRIRQTGNAGPQFFSAGEGILVVNLVLPSDPGLATVVYHTRDGGETWIARRRDSLWKTRELLLRQRGVAWGGGQLYVTRDAGQSWSTVMPNEDFTARLGSSPICQPAHRLGTDRQRSLRPLALQDDRRRRDLDFNSFSRM